jgi:hypothetical protein
MDQRDVRMGDVGFIAAQRARPDGVPNRIDYLLANRRPGSPLQESLRATAADYVWVRPSWR